MHTDNYWRRRRTLRLLGKGLAVVCVLVFTLFPVYFMVSSALAERVSTGTDALFPDALSLRHFEFVLTEAGFLRYMRNSLLVALVTVVGSGILALLAAVAVARFRFSMRTTVLVMILVIQMVPLEALVISLFLQMSNLGMLNSLLGLSIVYIALSVPFAVWMLRGFVAAIPTEIEEAAYIDGASWGRMFVSILLPLTAPGLVAVSVFAFILAWNEFILAFTFMTHSENYTAAVGLRQFFGQYTTDWGSVMAASTLITLPAVVFFLMIQRRIASGLVAGSVKG
ncbi:carbohydrate ABC transporter permease [Lipingzhangella sp. LS1_29]|uniref:Carbohydrate ABC transporter permease n=1 Tax=Lipingzhangella rawalii TaxID=2055835 RepID=A0ABU2H9J4_9ACTN|nr:carbohydrate ABC transporter permease [Lipingzhangella rawalii]MDS1271990.1 carbohydrate ABC transporter permease [Lipingzhangella rawalii]